MNNKGYIDIKKCIICEKEYQCRQKGKHGSRKSILRPKQASTCSQECSKIFKRVHYRYNGKLVYLRNKNKKLEQIIKDLKETIKFLKNKKNAK